MSNMGGSYRRSFFGFSAFALVLLALSAGPVYAQLDYDTPATTPVVQQQAQTATQTPAPAVKSTSAPSPQVGQNAGQQTSPAAGNSSIMTWLTFVSLLLFAVLLVVLIRRKRSGGLSKSEVQKIVNDAIGSLPKGPDNLSIGYY